MLHFIVWIVISGIAGFIASKIINNAGSGLFLDVILGIIGGIVGGFIVNHIPALAGLGGKGGFEGLIVEAIIAVVGAVIVIYVWNAVFRKAA